MAARIIIFPEVLRPPIGRLTDSTPPLPKYTTAFFTRRWERRALRLRACGCDAAAIPRERWWDSRSWTGWDGMPTLSTGVCHAGLPRYSHLLSLDYLAEKASDGLAHACPPPQGLRANDQELGQQQRRSSLPQDRNQSAL